MPHDAPAEGFELATAVAVLRLRQLGYPIPKDVIDWARSVAGKGWARRVAGEKPPNLGALIRETLAKQAQGDAPPERG